MTMLLGSLALPNKIINYCASSPHFLNPKSIRAGERHTKPPGLTSCLSWNLASAFCFLGLIQERFRGFFCEKVLLVCLLLFVSTRFGMAA